MRTFFTLLILGMVCLSPVFSQDSSSPSTTSPTQPSVTPITLQDGRQGFFVTREALEEFVLAKESIPIKDKEIEDLKSLGKDIAKRADSADMRNKILVGTTVVVPIVVLVLDELYHALKK